jgi:MATE family multidrug resistance protein
MTSTFSERRERRDRHKRGVASGEAALDDVAAPLVAGAGDVTTKLRGTGVRSESADAEATVNVMETIDDSVIAIDAASAARAATRQKLVALAWPVCVAMLGDTAMGVVDTKLVGGLGAAALGGVGIATTLMYVAYSIAFGVMRGVKVRTAFAIGEGRPQDGVRYAQAGLAIGAAMGVLFAVAAWRAEPLLWALHIDGAMVPHARAFLFARAFGAPAICMFSALVQHRQAMGDTRTPMRVGLIANVVNALVAWSLVYGHFGVPALGVRGAGLATAGVEWMNVAVFAALLRSERFAKASSISIRQAMREVGRVGFPTGAQFGLEMLAFTTFTAILGAIGAEQIAAHQIAMTVIRTSFLPGVAIAEAASILVGQSLGARRLDEADRVTKAAMLLAAGFMTAMGLLFASFGRSIAGVFADEPPVIAVARRLLLVAAVFQTLDAVTIVLRGCLRGAQDVRVVAVVGVSVAWCCIPSAAWLLGRQLGWGAFGGWCGFVAETSIAAAIFMRRWSRGSWRRAYA